MIKVLGIVIFLAFLPEMVLSQNTFEDLSGPEQSQILKSVRRKINELQEYIKITGDKSSTRSESDGAIEAALKLFQEGAQVEVSSLNRSGTRKYLVKDYLNRLRALKYDQVTIDFRDFIFIGDPKMGPDGKMRGSVVIEQLFEGKFKDGVIYDDISDKRVTYTIEREVNTITGEIVWFVYLNDILVEQTRTTK